MGVLLHKGRSVDVMLLCEGTYPYIRGGVSTWIHQLIIGMPMLTFGVVFLGSRPGDYDGVQYEFPENVRFVYEHFLFDGEEKKKPEQTYMSDQAVKELHDLHAWFVEKTDFFPEAMKQLAFFNERISQDHFLHSEEAWQFMMERYGDNAPTLPFIDYFWTVRSIHAPIWELAKIAEFLPQYKVLHSPSTGYAGFLGGLLHHDSARPLVLTEHGIYTRERKIDLLNADWLIDNKAAMLKELGEHSYIKSMWARFFEGIGHYCYDASKIIISLFEDARRIQIGYGAQERKTRVIPNGVHIERLAPLRREAHEPTPMVVALIGRVVSIKDIKTFIKAIHLSAKQIPQIQGWIVGPESESPEYVKECTLLVEMYGLHENLKFLGFQNIEEVLPKTGVLTLTSISEGMPLVILEGFAAGIPAVATDVGSCRQLIEGGIESEDVGKAGEVVNIADPSALSDAYVRLLIDKSAYEASRAVAIRRVEAYYSMERMLQNYRNVYEEAIEQWQA
jgi:glycosyltransferase involved in cell wall biosynthesis